LTHQLDNLLPFLPPDHFTPQQFGKLLSLAFRTDSQGIQQFDRVDIERQRFRYTASVGVVLVISWHMAPFSISLSCNLKYTFIIERIIELCNTISNENPCTLKVYRL